MELHCQLQRGGACHILYIRPKSLSLLDLLSVPLFSPLTFPNRIPVPSSSPITLLQRGLCGFLFAIVLLTISTYLSLLDWGGSHASYKNPTCIFWLLGSFFGTQLKMPEPTKKGRSFNSMLPACSWGPTTCYSLCFNCFKRYKCWEFATV